jgi:hydroxypyruvate isomerase
MRYSACIEWLFAAEAPDFADRIRAAKAAGLDAVEFWRFSNKDLDSIEKALRETGMPLAGILAETGGPLANGHDHERILSGISSSLAVAKRFGAPLMIVTTGDEQRGTSRAEQHASIVRVLKDAAKLVEGTGVTIALEPLNDRVDHPGYYLTSTEEGLDIIDEVGRPEVRLLYDIYHSAMMGEEIEKVLDGRLDRVAHVHLADAPGRGEPGSGAMDWSDRLEWLQRSGYEGYVGLEYRPSIGTVEGLAFRF